jgi:hypothetical protein
METGEPLDKLSNGARAWCQEQGSSATTVSEIINGPDEKVKDFFYIYYGINIEISKNDCINKIEIYSAGDESS